MRFFVLIVWIVAMLNGQMTWPAFAAERAIVAINHAPPFRIVETRDGREYYSGIYIDTIKAASERLDIDLEFHVVPFRRALRMMQTGEADIMLGPNRKPDREQYMLYLDQEVFREDKVFFLSRDAEDVSSYDELSGLQIGVLRGAVYFDGFDQDVALNKYAFSDYLTGFRLLDAMRLDALIAPDSLGRYWMTVGGFEFRAASYRVAGRPSFFALSRKSTLVDRAADLGRILKSMAESGQIDEINRRYR